MRFLSVLVLFLLCSCGSFLHSGSRGSLSDATEKSHNEDPAERKVGHDYAVDPEYRPDVDHYTSETHYDYRRDTLHRESEFFDYSSSAGVPQYKSRTRDSLQRASVTQKVPDRIDTTVKPIKLDSIDLGIEKTVLKRLSGSVTPSMPTRVTQQGKSGQKTTSTKPARRIPSEDESAEHNFAFGFEADPQLLLSKNFSKAIGGTLFIGRAIDNERTFGKQRHYLFGKLGFHEYRIHSDDSLFNEFKYNELNCFMMGMEYIRYYGAVDNPLAAPYFIVNGTYEILGFDYVNPLIDSVSNEEIFDDNLSSISVATGSGVTFLNSSPLRLGVNVTAGFRIYGFTTFEEFDNDLFKPELFLRGAVKLWLDMGFKKNKKGPLRK